MSRGRCKGTSAAARSCAAAATVGGLPRCEEVRHRAIVTRTSPPTPNGSTSGGFTLPAAQAWGCPVDMVGAQAQRHAYSWVIRGSPRHKLSSPRHVAGHEEGPNGVS
jgi:hypothetical protein